MAGCTCENWSLQDLSSALQDMHKDNKKIVVPMFQRGNRDKYWFAYRRNPLEDLKKCDEVSVVYGCKDESTMVSLPVSLIEEHIDALNISKDDDGKITHWHMVFFKDVSGNMTWLLSKPDLQEISIDKYIM